ncbi:MAG: NUDIX domain-containing protein [Candidatus Aenigmatarchaeota archaeon]
MVEDGLMAERVLVVKAQELKTIAIDAGFSEFDKNLFATICKNRFFVDRDKAENNETLKQIIPYCIVVNNSKIVVVKRKNPGEKRLKDLLSIGIGGHINPVDDTGDVYENAARRELNEELKTDKILSLEPVGFLNLDDIPVNRVHLGLVYVARVAGNVEVIDSGLEGELKNIAEIATLSDKMEGWSRELAKAIANGKIKI